MPYRIYSATDGSSEDHAPIAKHLKIVKAAPIADGEIQKLAKNKQCRRR